MTERMEFVEPDGNFLQPSFMTRVVSMEDPEPDPEGCDPELERCDPIEPKVVEFDPAGVLDDTQQTFAKLAGIRDRWLEQIQATGIIDHEEMSRLINFCQGLEGMKKPVMPSLK